MLPSGDSMGRDQRRLRQRAGTYFMACHCLLWVVLVAAVGSFAQEEVLLANLLPPAATWRAIGAICFGDGTAKACLPPAVWSQSCTLVSSRQVRQQRISYLFSEISFDRRRALACRSLL